MTEPSLYDGVSTPPEERFAEWVLECSSRRPAEIEVVSRGLPPGRATSGDLMVVFEGLLHDADELRRTLGVAPDEPRSDAELVADTYARWGMEAFARLRGTWLVAIADGAKGVLVCARDPLGLHPAFYAQRDGKVLVSPSVEALVRDGSVSKVANRAALADHLLHRWPVLDETYYEAVKRLPGGHWMTVRDGETTIRRYWDLPEQDERAADESDEDQARFDELLEQAVARCVAQPAGIYLSGGLDSVSVAAVASQVSRSRGFPGPHALSLVFEHESCNEENVQLQVARQLSLDQTILPVSRAVDARGLLRSAVDTSAERPAPLLNLWTPAYRYLALDAKARGLEVILTGNGGDEWLEFPIRFAATLIRRGDVVRLFRIWQSMQRSYPLSTGRITWNLLWAFGTRPLLGEAGRKLLAPVAPGVVRARRRRYLEGLLRGWIAPGQDLREQLHERHVRSLEQRATSLDSPILALELEEFFESGRRLGLRLLHPLWDPDLGAFLARTPVEARILGGRSKAFVRRSLARRFPALGFEGHRKVTGTSFYRSLLDDEGGRVWRDLGGVRALGELEIVDPTLLERDLDRVLFSPKPADRILVWQLLSVEAWVRGNV